METNRLPIIAAVLTAVASTQIFAIGHDSEKNVLTVQFPKRKDGLIVGGGSVYQYQNVTAEKFNDFLAAESKGKFFGEHIRDNDAHPCQKLTDEEVAEFINPPAPAEAGGVNAARELEQPLQQAA